MASSKTMEKFQNPEWKGDDELQTDLKKYVLQNLKRSEILDFMNRVCSQYAWSLGTLSRKFNYFNIKYINYDVTVEEVEEVMGEDQMVQGSFYGIVGYIGKFESNVTLQFLRACV